MADPLSREQIAELSADLHAVQLELLEQLKSAGDDSKPVQLDQQMVGRLSRMDAMQQQQMTRASQVQAKAHLSRVLLALKAIKGEEYGWCNDCDEPIAFPRLKARPDARLCLNCQTKKES